MTDNKKRHRITVRLPFSMKAKLKKLSFKKDMTQNDILSDVIVKHVNKELKDE